MKAGKRKSSSYNKLKTTRTAELKIVASPHRFSASSFNLPHGWTVEQRPRRSNPAASHHSFDTYYYEPVTGRQFRSMISIQRYLNGQRILKCRSNSFKFRHVNNMKIVPRLRSGTKFNLPKGWIVQEQPRKNVNFTGHIDRYYIEPGTERRFRSLVSAERYLARKNGYTAVRKGQTEENQSRARDQNVHSPSPHMQPSNDSGSHGKNLSGKQAENSALVSCPPPAKIKWVLNGLGGNAWSPVVDDSPVSESVKQNWSETFFLTLNDRM